MELLPGTGRQSALARRTDVTVLSFGVQVYFCLVRSCGGGQVVPPLSGRGPGSGSGFGGPVARSRSRSWSRSWSGFGGPVARSRSRFYGLVLVARWPGPGPGPGSCPGPLWWRWLGPGPCPVRKRITYAVWPASMSPGMDAQSLPEYGCSTLFSKPLVRGKQYCEVGTIIEQKQQAKRLPKPTA